MIKHILFFVILLFIVSCENSNNSEQDSIEKFWVFVANEGSYGSSNGSISMINELGEVYQTEAIGDIVQSLEVYGNKLIVLVNNSHIIKVFEITSEGLAMPGIEVSTDGSSPRELVVINDKVYFTNWTSQDIKVLNLFNYNIETTIPVNGLPEDLMIDGNDLWVTINMNADWSAASTVIKIDMSSNTITETVEVGPGPQELAKLNGEIFVSRTFYDSDWNAEHGATKIGSEVLIKNYGIGAPCGGSILKHESYIMRSFNGGLARMNSSLELENVTIGDFSQDQIYHVEKIDDKFWFAITDHENLNEVYVLDSTGNIINVYDVGISPGDFAI